MIQDIEISEEDFKDPEGFQISYLNQIPHKKQVEVLLSPQKNKIIVCGRRSGKTQMVAGELIRGAVLKIYPKQILIAPQYKQAMIVFNKIIELMQHAGVHEDILKAVQSPSPEITFKNGGYIYFASADNPNSLRGEAWDRVFKDESAFIKKGADNALKPLTYDKGAPIWETTTPWGKGEVWERWLRGTKGDPDYGCFHYNYKDNPYLSPEGVKEIEKDIIEYGESSIYVQAEILGNFVEDRDAYFSRELVESCIMDYDMAGAIHPKHIYCSGTDFARMGEDSNVTIVLEDTKENNIIKVFDIEETNHQKLTEAIGRIKILDNKYNLIKMYLDQTGLGSGPTDMLTESLGGYKVEGMTFTLRSKQDMYSNLKKLMTQGRLKIPNNKKLIYQLLDLRYETTSGGDLKLHHSERGHDDYPDALALAAWYFKEQEEVEFEAWIQ